MQEYAKHMLSTFYYTEYLQEKKSVLDATEPKNRTVLKKVHGEACLLGIKIFWMSNKTIIEFSFRMLWRIMPISESIIHLSLKHSPRSA